MKLPRAGDLWAPPRGPVTMILKPQGRSSLLVATIHVRPKQRGVNAHGLARKFSKLGFRKVGRVVS